MAKSTTHNASNENCKATWGRLCTSNNGGQHKCANQDDKHFGFHSCACGVSTPKRG